MSITKIMSVFCDHAEAELSGEGCPHWIANELTTADARSIAGANGWRRVDSGFYHGSTRLKYDLSPECFKEWQNWRHIRKNEK